MINSAKKKKYGDENKLGQRTNEIWQHWANATGKLMACLRAAAGTDPKQNSFTVGPRWFDSHVHNQTKPETMSMGRTRSVNKESTLRIPYENIKWRKQVALFVYTSWSALWDRAILARAHAHYRAICFAGRTFKITQFRANRIYSGKSFEAKRQIWLNYMTTVWNWQCCFTEIYPNLTLRLKAHSWVGSVLMKTEWFFLWECHCKPIGVCIRENRGESGCLSLFSVNLLRFYCKQHTNASVTTTLILRFGF